MVKKEYIAGKPKEEKPFRLIKRFFLQTESFNKIQEVPFERIQKFSEKSHSAQKTNGGTLRSPLYFWKHKKILWFSARLEPTLSCFSDPRKLAGQKVEQMNIKVDRSR